MNDSAHNYVSTPSSLIELWTDWNRVPGATLFSGNSSWLRKQNGRFIALPGPVISLENIEELRKVDRTERYLDIGSTVNLNKILTLGKILPEALSLAIKSTSTKLLRNLTTLGSCIRRQSTPEPVVAGLVALDSRYEFRTALQSCWVQAGRFATLAEPVIIEPKECLTRIRIPLESWDYTLCRDFSTKESGDNGNEFVIFVARIHKNILTGVRLIVSGATILRDKDSEMTLIGNKLPLDKKITENFLHVWREHLSAIDNRSEFQKAKLLNFIEQAIFYFAY